MDGDCELTIEEHVMDIEIAGLVLEMGRLSRFGPLEILILHMLKFQYQPERQKSGWTGSICSVLRVLSKVSTSDRNKMKEKIDLEAVYAAARDTALNQTGLDPSDIPDQMDRSIYNIDYLCSIERVQSFINSNWAGDENVNTDINPKTRRNKG